MYMLFYLLFDKVTTVEILKQFDQISHMAVICLLLSNAVLLVYWIFKGALNPNFLI